MIKGGGGCGARCLLDSINSPVQTFSVGVDLGQRFEHLGHPLPWPSPRWAFECELADSTDIPRNIPIYMCKMLKYS